MAKQMSYTDSRGNEYSASYWNIDTVAVSPVKQIVQIIFFGYKNAAARQANLDPIETKMFSVSVAKFQDYFSLAQIEGPGKNALKACYNYVTAEETFFTGASDVA